MKTFIKTILILSAFMPFQTFSQKIITTSNSDSSLSITRDAKLDAVIEMQKKLNLEKQTVPGYRIQIYFGVNRQKASEIKLDFAGKYSDVAAYLTYQQPNFKVRVGDFTSRFEARKFLRDLEGKYPTTFIVPDDVRLPLLK
ncbi:MAG: SPOR domain-containing protein [Bacteroidia bacterium]|nr:SPOR domain-containing protein [Bacteroidia bacterium]